MNYRLQNAEKTSGFTINTHQKCLKFDDKTPKNALDFQGKNKRCDLPRKAFSLLVMIKNVILSIATKWVARRKP